MTSLSNRKANTTTSLRVKQKREYSIIYLHGFSATRQELSPLIENLADQLQANAYFTRLKGHGRSDDAMSEGSVQAWTNEAKTALEIGRLLGNKVIVIGTSTGGTLAAWLSAQADVRQLSASILISPNFGVKSRFSGILQSRLGLWLVKTFQGKSHSFEPINEYHAKYWTERYPIDALVPMLDLVDIVNDMEKSLITTPQLLVYSPDDQVIDVSAIERTAKQITSAEVSVVPFTKSKDPVQHVLVGQMSSPDEVGDMVAVIVNFLTKNAVFKP